MVAIITTPDIGIVLLAAGASRRMGRDKLTLDLGKGPMVRLVAQAALASHAKAIVVVTGLEGEAVRAALEGMPLGFVENPDAAQGMATSLRVGLQALDPAIAGAVVCLGDMPETSAVTIDALIAAFADKSDAAACVPVQGGQRGNPVLLARRLFEDACALGGDAGARKLLAKRDDVVEVEVIDAGIHLDLDDEAALAAYRAGR